MAHDVSTPPFPPPVPRASPDQLLQEIRQGFSGYELSRLVAIEATQRVLSKHLSEMAAINERMGVLFNERAEMQKRCHTEHLRLIQILMANKNQQAVPPQSAYAVPGDLAQSPRNNHQTTYKKLRRQIASAAPSKQNDILHSHRQRATEPLQRPVSPHLVEEIMQLDNVKFLALIFSARKLDDWLQQKSSRGAFPRPGPGCPLPGGREWT